jgi:hypothetical protein
MAQVKSVTGRTDGARAPSRHTTPVAGLHQVHDWVVDPSTHRVFRPFCDGCRPGAVGPIAVALSGASSPKEACAR